MLRKLYRFYRKNHFGINGAITGAVLGFCLIFLGIIKTIILFACIIVGYFIGRKLQSDKNFIKDFIDRILPPGKFR